jgi:hypothetical protein
LHAFVSEVCVQAFLAYRIRKISGRWEITIICWTLAFLAFAGSVFVCTKSILASDPIPYDGQWSWLVTTMLAIIAFVNVLIAASLSYYLWAKKQHVYMR